MVGKYGGAFARQRVSLAAISSGWRRSFSTSSTDEFLSGQSRWYIDEMHEAWRRDPRSVHASWAAYFSGLARGLAPSEAFSAVPGAPVALPPHLTEEKEIVDHLKVQQLVRAYRFRGHLAADLDPLRIVKPISPGASTVAPELSLEYYGFSKADLGRPFYLGEGVLPHFFRPGASQMTLGEIVDALGQVYCKRIGYEFMHIPERERCQWIRSRIEVPEPPKLEPTERLKLLDRLAWACLLERFLMTKYPADKRFGLEGGEALVPGMIDILYRLSDAGATNVVLGMAHRGRINVLTNVVRKPFESVLASFNGIHDAGAVGTGDVKYHLGLDFTKQMGGGTGRTLDISLLANPSHLEAVNPVVLGKSRALQFLHEPSGDNRKAAVVPILIHGDASFAGQGVVYESLGLAGLPNYTVGGTIHLIINNQIGFTTDPRFARSTPYCSDVAKTLDAPIFHVNGDDPEAVIHACRLAADWRIRYQTDVVVDVVCYRRHGHNEMDQPAFTQPRMYKAIAGITPVFDAYADRLLGEGLIDGAQLEALRRKVLDHFEAKYAESKSYKPTAKEWVSSRWQGFMTPKELRETCCAAHRTGVPVDALQAIGRAASSFPGDFTPHPGIRRIMEARRKAVEEGADIDMPTAEALAFGSLLAEGHHVRLSGQDVERGTFSQRHAVLHDQQVERQYVPLSHVSPKQAPFSVCNSSLSEYAVLGFELGYSQASPRHLVLWEAQFGDFANTAQPIIDQFIASGESKWLQRTALTMLLPHGYDGAGPEHSNGHIERFLSLCEEDPFTAQLSDEDNPRTRQLQDCNIQVVMPSTPANYFHALRRQIHRDFRKPLVCFNSKSLLRHPLARSALAEMATGTRFQKVFPAILPPKVAPSAITRLVFCSGQVYYALAKAKEANALDHVALARIEQLSPFPWEQVAREADRFPNASALVWAQEEALNLGPWAYVEPRLETALNAFSKTHKGKRARYAGRRTSGAVATGYKSLHLAEEYGLLAEALLGVNLQPKSVHNGVPLWK